MDPLIKPSELPATLWIPDYVTPRHATWKGALIIPEKLQEAYREALVKLGLASKAESETTEDGAGAVGGASDAEAADHFAKRFSASLGRVQLYALDPAKKFATSLDALIEVFSAETVNILDIPLGAGASSLAIISAISELRHKKALEARPLKVVVTGGDISPWSLKVAQDLFKALTQWWAEQNIDVTLTTMEWDVLSNESTIDLVDKWLEPDAKTGRYALVGGNFSGFLGSTVTEGKQERWMHRANGQLRQIIGRGAKRNLQLFWVEPKINQARNHFLPYLHTEIGAATKKIAPAFSGARESEGLMLSCIAKDDEFITRAAGIHYKPA